MRVDDVVTGIGEPHWSPCGQHVALTLTLRSPDGQERPWTLRLYPPAAMMLAADLGDFLGFGEPSDEDWPEAVH